jgi:hypothetical protein
MAIVRKQFFFYLLFLILGCTSIGSVESKSLVQRGLDELSKYDGKNKDINNVRVDGLPLFIVLSLDGINEAYIREYESKGGTYNFPGYLLNALCERGKFDEALYFIQNKKINSSPFRLDKNQGSCLLTAINKQNSQAFEKFLLIAKSSSDSEVIDGEVTQLLEDRIQTLQGFLND